jgi:hypothetical protein
MHVRVIALALPFALGIACTHARSHGTARTANPQTAGEQTATAPAPSTDSSAPGTATGSAAPAPSGTDTAQSTNESSASREPSAPALPPGSDTGSTASAQSDEASGSTASKDPIIEQGDPVKGHAEDSVVSGKIARVLRRSVVIVSDSGDQSSLLIVPETTIEVDGRDAHRSDLQEGQDVRASFDEVNGRNVAVRIRAGSGARAPSPDDPSWKGPSDGPSQGSSGSFDGGSSPGSTGSAHPQGH